jgi:putative ABC transport system substrate-binding protein
MRRRDFLALLGGATGWSLSAQAQQTMAPTIGYLSALSESQVAAQTAAFRGGLREAGFAEGVNVAIDFQWAEGQFQRLPAMAAELVRRPVELILAQAPPAALAAKAATATIPIVFVVGFDPVGAGLVASLNQPNSNATGMSLFSTALGQKRLELLRDISPKASAVAMLVNPFSPDSLPEISSVQAAAPALGLQITIFNASTPREIDIAFKEISEKAPSALLVATDPFYVNQRDQIVTLAAHLGVPAIYPFRDYATAGGLMSYGTNIPRLYRQAGIYAGRILKGAKPAELPVIQPTSFELVINLKTAQTLAIDIPATLHARSDEVIE